MSTPGYGDSWIILAITKSKETLIINYSDDWRDWIEGIQWCDNFDEDPPELNTGMYKWSNFKIGQWEEDELMDVTGGIFRPFIPHPTQLIDKR